MSEGSILTPTLASRKLVVTAVALFCALAVVGGYSVREYRAAKQMSVQNAQMGAALQETRSQIEALAAKLNAMSAPAPSETAVRASTGQAVARRTTTHRRRSDDPRWKQIQSKLDEHQKAIESTQQELAGARIELGGSIARTHEELVALQKKGERSYFEFDLDKTGQFARQGPVGLKLKKANTKHQYADLEMMVDDVKLSKKHVNLFEPVLFYPTGSQQAVEMVINRITKNHIHGYVSEPKYKPSELAAMSAASQATTTATATNTAASDGAEASSTTSAATSKPRRRVEIH